MRIARFFRSRRIRYAVVPSMLAALVTLIAMQAERVIESRHARPKQSISAESAHLDAARKALKPRDDFPYPCDNLYSVVCRTMHESIDPSGIVRKDIHGEVRALRLYEDIKRGNPDLDADQVDAKLVAEIYDKARSERAIHAFEWAQDAAIRFIDSQGGGAISRKLKKKLKSRLKSIRLDLPTPTHLYDDEPDLYTKDGIFYERMPDGTLRIRVGGAYLLSINSWFNLVFTFGHEVAHSIDPCELRDLGIAQPDGYTRLNACFIAQRVVALRTDREECIANDQLAEAFADWFGVQLASKNLKKFSTEFDYHQTRNAIRNTVRDLCEEDDSLDEIDDTNHPSPKIRIERIFGANPTIREMLRCSAQPAMAEYCNFDIQNQTLTKDAR